MHSSQWSMILDDLIYKMQSVRDFSSEVDILYDDDVCIYIIGDG